MDCGGKARGFSVSFQTSVAFLGSIRSQATIDEAKKMKRRKEVYK